jgi:hypothetical protein
MEVTKVSDLDLERLADDRGPPSVEAKVVEQLRRQRARDHQVHVFQVGNYYFIGPVSNAQTELDIIAWVEGGEEEGGEPPTT